LFARGSHLTHNRLANKLAPTGPAYAWAKPSPRGSEFIRECGCTADASLSNVLAPSRMNSLPPEGLAPRSCRSELVREAVLYPTHHLRLKHRLRKQACSHRFCGDPSPVGAAEGCEGVVSGRPFSQSAAAPADSCDRQLLPDPRGSEFIRECGCTADASLSNVLTPSRMNSLPPDGLAPRSCRSELVREAVLHPTHHLRLKHRLRKQACSHRFCGDPSPVGAAEGCEGVVSGRPFSQSAAAPKFKPKAGSPALMGGC